MKRVKKLANEFVDVEMAMENHCCKHCYEAGFRRALRELLDLEPGRTWLEQPSRIVSGFADEEVCE